MDNEYLEIALPIIERGTNSRQMLVLRLHPKVIAALQFSYGHPRATLLYLRLLTHRASRVDNTYEVQFPSEEALLEELQPGVAWQRIQPILRAYIADFQLTSHQRNEVLSQYALQKTWTQITKRAREILLTRRGIPGLPVEEEKALAQLFNNKRLSWQVRAALDSVLLQLPFLSFGRKEIQLQRCIKQLRVWEVVEAELDWLAEIGLIQCQYAKGSLNYLLTPLVPPHNLPDAATQQINYRESDMYDE